MRLGGPINQRLPAHEGAAVHGPVAQGAFLRRLGIAERAERLKTAAAASPAAAIDAALTRLTGGDTNQMGELFRVMAMADPRLPALPGFETAGADR